MAKNVELLDNGNEILYPRTVTEQVAVTANQNLKEKLNEMDANIESVTNEVKDARTNGNTNITYNNLKARLDDEHKKLNNEIEKTNTQLSNMKKYKINVKDFGANGDGINDDTFSIQTALNFCKDTYDNDDIRCTLYFPQGLYKITSPLTLSNTSFNLQMDGYLYLDKNVKYGFVLDRLKNISLDLKIKGNNMLISDFNYAKDWASNIDGMTVGIRLVGCTSVKLNSDFDKFYGRGIESEGSWQFDFGHSKGQVGQFIFIKRTNGAGLLNAGIGNIGSIHVEEIVGSYFNGTDINITYYENYIPKSDQALGLRFEECHSVWITNLSVGYYGRDYMVAFDRCTSVHASHLYCYGRWSHGATDENCGSGLYMSQCHSCQMDVMTSGCKRALMINGLVSSIINWTDTSSRDLGAINAIDGFPVRAVTLNCTSKSRYGNAFEINNNSTDGQTVDGLTINANMTDRNALSTNVNDIRVTDANAIIYLNGKVGNVILPKSNKCILNCKYDLISNDPLIDLMSTTKSVSASVLANGYTLALGLENKISRFGNIVMGTFAIEHPAKTGQLSRASYLVQIPEKYRPSKTVAITINIICEGTDNHYERTAFVNIDGRVQMQGVGIFTDDIRWITSSFSYVV